MSGEEIRALSWPAVAATLEREKQLAAEHADAGYDCTYCQDTGVAPAPEPYGSMGCTWACPRCAMETTA